MPAGLTVVAAVVLALIGAASASGACPNEGVRHGVAAGLPDCRAYEMVSPPDKHGGEVMPQTQRTRAARAETAHLPMAMAFSSLTGFGDVHGDAISTEYLSQRTLQPNTNGWSTHGITPFQQPGDFFATILGGDHDPLFLGDFSNDLTRGVFRSWSPLTDASNVKDVPNLYTRNDLRTPGSGSWTLLTDAFAPLQRSLDKPFFADASADFSHVIFESAETLTPEVPGCTPGPGQEGCPPHLYEAVNGVVRLAGILPDTACGLPPCVAASSVAGQGQAEGGSANHETPHTISDDGSRIIFTDRSTGDLYMRTDGASTVQLNASESANPSGPATYWDASVDGGRVFFTSQAALASDTPADSHTRLFMYSVVPDAFGHHLTALVDGADAVIGASDDGQYVYLVAGDVFVWHDDSGIPQLDDIGPITTDDLRQNLSNYDWSFFAFKSSRVTSDGRHLLFASSDGSGLTGYDQTSACVNSNFDSINGCSELYVYSVEPEGPDHAHLHCASCDPSGAPARSDAADTVKVDRGLSQITWHAPRAVSDDGRFVFFHTPDALVPQDINGKFDAYEYDVADGSVHLLSNGTDASDSYFLDASADGRDAFIATRARLVGWDIDTARDLYDVRVDGGVPDPPAGSLPCSDDACRGALSAAPAAPTIGNAPPHSPTSVPAKSKPKRKRLACRRGFVRKRVKGRVRCVRKRHRARHAHANHARRASVPVHAERKGR